MIPTLAESIAENARSDIGEVRFRLTTLYDQLSTSVNLCNSDISWETIRKMGCKFSSPSEKLKAIKHKVRLSGY